MIVYKPAEQNDLLFRLVLFSSEILDKIFFKKYLISESLCSNLIKRFERAQPNNGKTTKPSRRIDRVAKELAWKASRAERPRGFESHVLRQNKNRVQNALCFYFLTWARTLRGQNGPADRSGPSTRKRAQDGGFASAKTRPMSSAK